MPSVPRQFTTADGHNPEIIYHILENQEEFGPKPSYQALDNYLRFRGTSNQRGLNRMEAVRREEDATASRAHPRSRERPVDFSQSPLSDEYLEALGSTNMSEEEAASLVSSWAWEGPVDVPQSPLIGEYPEALGSANMSQEDAAASRAHSRSREGPVDVPQSPLIGEYPEALGSANMSQEDAAASRAHSRSREGPVDFPQSPLGDGYPEALASANMSQEDAAASLGPTWPWEGPVDFPQSPLGDGYPEALGSVSMSEDEPGIYRALMERLAARESMDLGRDTDDILDRDYFNGVHQIYRAQEVVRHMTREKHGKLQNFSPQYDWIRAELEDGGEPMIDGPFEILLPDPVIPGKVSCQRVTLPHVYLPGWAGRPYDNLLSVAEWKYAMKLAEGRYHKLCMFYEGSDIGLSDTGIILGFPSMHTFAHFIHRPEIKEAFRELWDASLKNLPGEKQLAVDKHERRPVGLRILYSRGLEGGSEFDAKNPNKRDWPLDSHLARFCLKVERVCNRWKLPPMRGQIPMLAGKAPTSVVAWGGVELARILRRMQKGYGSRIRYLDQDPSM